MAEVVGVMFKGNRKEFFLNKENIPLQKKDSVVVEVERGEDIGYVVEWGEYTREKAKKQRVKLRNIVKKSTDEEKKKLERIRSKEEDAKNICQEKIRENKLDMKLVDVECQFDEHKMSFYFTSEERVDFRKLVKELAGIFRTRIELKQIGARDEAKRVAPGYGPCGRTLCCQTHLTEFVPVTLKCAKDQYLSLNPTQLTGVCGRLKCCLTYERSYYVETSRRFPKVGVVLQTDKGMERVTSIEIIAESVGLQTEGGVRRDVSLDEFNKIAGVLDGPPSEQGCNGGCGDKSQAALNKHK